LAAARLRADGDQAYFYHGPNRSLVTVGLFTEQDFGVEQQPAPDGGVLFIPTYGQRVRELQKKFSYNLGNGRTIIEKSGDKKLGEQPSFLVRVR
jgi:hypothetical protein